jgi:predicted RNase H-like HicB family nuclease
LTRAILSFVTLRRFGTKYGIIEVCERPEGKDMASFRYTVIFEREADGGYHVFCPSLKGCHSQGDTLDEAQRNIEEAIAAYLESLRAHGEPIPSEEILVRPVDVVL